MRVLSPTVTDLMVVAKELSKMRTLAQKGENAGDLRQCYAECMLLDRYGRLPSMADFKRDSRKRVTMYPKDGNGALIRTIAHSLIPWRVYKNWLNADVFVLIKTGTPTLHTSIISGWLPLAVLRDMPTMGDNETRIVDPAFLLPMPDDFTFVEAEHHLANDWHGIWDETHMGWECCTCGRMIPDPKMLAAIERGTA